MTIKLKVTPERWGEIINIDDEMHFGELTRKEVYEYMLQFCINGNETYLPIDEARKLFKKVPSKDLSEYITKFFKAVSDAFVNPTNGATSDEQSSQE